MADFPLSIFLISAPGLRVQPQSKLIHSSSFACQLEGEGCFVARPLRSSANALQEKAVICHPNPSHFFSRRKVCNNLTSSVISWLGHSQDQEPSAPDTDWTKHLIAHFMAAVGTQVMEQDPDVQKSSSHNQKLCGLRICHGLVVVWQMLHFTRGAAEKGSSYRRKRDLVMNDVWEQSKSNVFKAFHWLLLCVRNHRLSCSPARTKVGMQHSRGPEMKLWPQKMRGHKKKKHSSGYSFKENIWGQFFFFFNSTIKNSVFLLFHSFSSFLEGRFQAGIRWRAIKSSPQHSPQDRELMAACPCGQHGLGRMPRAWEIFPNTCHGVQSVHPWGKTNLLSRDAPGKQLWEMFYGAALWTGWPLKPHTHRASASRSKALCQVPFREAQSLICLFFPQLHIHLLSL